MTYDRGFQYWFCPRCKGEFWEDSAELEELREDSRDKQAQAQLVDLYKWHVMGASWKPILPPVCVYIKGSQGQRKTNRAPRKRKKTLEDLYEALKR